MASFDSVVTTPGLERAAVEDRLRRLAETGGDPGRPWQGQWWTAATAGTTGSPAVLVWDRTEWATVLASYARSIGWARVPAGPRHPLRMAVVSTTQPTHQSAVVGASLHSPMVRALRLDARAPLDEITGRLDEFRPDLLVGYSSALRVLALEQLAGRLAVAPKAVMSASEVLSAPAAATMESAWGNRPFDVYAATETAGIASSCIEGRRHLYEDLVVAESVDEDFRPVPPGEAGARLLVSVLFSRTIPLIRYEISDRVTLAEGDCPCGMPYRLVDAIGGRAEDTLRAGNVVVDVEALRPVVEAAGAVRWQAEEGPSGSLVVRVVAGDVPLEAAALEAGLRRRLEERGRGAAHVRVEIVPGLERTRLGKAAVVRRGRV